MSTGIRSSGLSRQTVMTGSAGHLAALLLLLLELLVLASGCAARSNPGALPAADAQETTHRVHVVRAADVPLQAWPARREFADVEYLEVGWGDRAYYQAPDPSVWLGLRALLWPTAGVLHVAAFSGPVEHYFASAEIVALQVTPQGLARLVAAISANQSRSGRGFTAAVASTRRTKHSICSRPAMCGSPPCCARPVCRSVRRCRRPRARCLRSFAATAS